MIMETLLSLCSGKRDTAVEGLLPKMKHKVTVIAVYHDRVEKEDSIEYSHTGRPRSHQCELIPNVLVCCDLSLNADRCGPGDVCITPAFSGSPNATITWAFNGETSDNSGFEVTVEVEGEGVVSKGSVRSDERRVMLGNLQPSKNHIITVTAMYADKIERDTSLQYRHSGMYLL